MSTPPGDFTLIHIGKCGGSTVSSLLEAHRVRFQLTHMTRVRFDPAKRYVIVIRNPIQRFVSAFHWRYKLVVVDKTQNGRFRGEAETLEHYGSANKLAETIETFDIDKTYIHHIKEDISYHLRDFLADASSSNSSSSSDATGGGYSKKECIRGVITTEQLNEDVKALFGVDNTIHEKRNTLEKPALSSLGRANLRKYLEKDYECIDTLYKMGCLTKEQYAVLSE